MSVSDRVFKCKDCNIELTICNKMKNRRVCVPCYRNRNTVNNNRNRDKINERMKQIYRDKKELERKGTYSERNGTY